MKPKSVEGDAYYSSSIEMVLLSNWEIKLSHCEPTLWKSQNVWTHKTFLRNNLIIHKWFCRRVKGGKFVWRWIEWWRIAIGELSHTNIFFIMAWKCISGLEENVSRLIAEVVICFCLLLVLDSLKRMNLRELPSSSSSEKNYVCICVMKMQMLR